ncbi:MAG: hypothetical protein EPN58_00145 [Rhodanobacter sp.]|nr:MAG: hypothetical protein EPN58_00145 [Rhodanobacter sp.]
MFDESGFSRNALQSSRESIAAEAAPTAKHGEPGENLRGQLDRNPARCWSQVMWRMAVARMLSLQSAELKGCNQPSMKVAISRHRNLQWADA